MKAVHNIFSARDARNRFPELIRRASSGQEVVIARRGVPVARLISIPLQKTSTAKERRAAIEKWRKLSKNITLGGLKRKVLIAKGRR